jgi:hypothetical protein
MGQQSCGLQTMGHSHVDTILFESLNVVRVRQLLLVRDRESIASELLDQNSSWRNVTLLKTYSRVRK